jgi:SAM-dependent methyltransferase
MANESKGFGQIPEKKRNQPRKRVEKNPETIIEPVSWENIDSIIPLEVAKWHDQVSDLYKKEIEKFVLSELSDQWRYSDGNLPPSLEKMFIDAFRNSPKSILDVGAGRAGFMEKLGTERQGSKKNNLYALNLTPQLSVGSCIREINTDLDSFVTNPYQLIRNQSKTEIAPRSFDVIISQHGPFHHSPIPGKTLLQMLKLLNREGQLLLVDANLETTGANFLQEKFGWSQEKAFSSRISDYDLVNNSLKERKLVEANSLSRDGVTTLIFTKK